jgi:hypothetical protein
MAFSRNSEELKMTTDEIIKGLDKLIKEFGAATDVRGLADEQIGYGNYKQIMGRYQVLLHNLMRLVQEQSEQVKALEAEVAKLDKPGAGPKVGGFA